MFGFAGFVMPAEEVRAFGTWFFQRKRELLDFEIRRSGKHPAVWEKKGSSLYRAANLSRYRGQLAPCAAAVHVAPLGVFCD